MTEKRQPKFFYGYIVVLVGFVIMMTMLGALNTFGVFFKPLSEEFVWTRAMTSGAYSLAMLLSGFLAIVTGRLNDRFGPRIIATVCGFLLGLGFLLMSQISAVWQLYVFYGGIIGVGMSGGFAPLSSTISRWFVKRRGMMTGITTAGIGAGTMIMPPVGNWLISTFGWRTSYIILGITALVLITLAAQFLRRDPSQVGQIPYGVDEVQVERSNLQARGFSLREAMYTKQFWMLCLVFFCAGLPPMSLIVHIVPHATELGISPDSAANILAIIGGTNIVGTIVFGNAADRIGSKLSFALSFTLMAGALFWLTAAQDLRTLYLVAAIFGLGWGAQPAVHPLITGELFGLSSLGALVGFFYLLVTIGGAVGPIMAGRIFDVTGTYQLAWLTCAGISVVGTILNLLLKPTSGK